MLNCPYHTHEPCQWNRLTPGAHGKLMACSACHQHQPFRTPLIALCLGGNEKRVTNLAAVLKHFDQNFQEYERYLR